MDNGFIPIRRSLFNHFLFKEKRAFSRFEAWLDLIQMATFQEENTKLVKGKTIKCKKGQLVASVRFLQDRWSWSTHKVCDFIELLRSQDMLLTDKEEGINRITLINFEKHNNIAFNETLENGKRNSKKGHSKIKEEKQGTEKGTQREQSGNSQGTNINKENKVKEGEGESADADTQAFKRFNDWLERNAPRVVRMREPFTVKQFLKISSNYSPEIVRALLTAMHNWKDLDKRISAYLTFLKFKDVEDKRKNNATTDDDAAKRQKAVQRTRDLENQ